MLSRIFFLFALLLPIGAQAADQNSVYYSVRPDFRRCVSPLCGGVFVQRVNQIGTRCADGRVQRECYVAEVDLSALKLSDDDAGTVQSKIKTGGVLLKGRLRNKAFGDFGTLGEFVAAEVWEAANDATPTGTFFRALDKNLVCITSPCLSFQIEKLNGRSQRDVAGVDLGPVGASDAQLQAAYVQMKEPEGILVAGSDDGTVSGPGGTAPTLIASQFYLPVRADIAPQSCYVGGCSGEICSDRPDAVSACIYREEYACYRTAVCERQPAGNCGWTPTPELKACLDAANSGGKSGFLLDTLPGGAQ